MGTDAVLIGSSRTAFIDSAFFKDSDAFNMAVNGMTAPEYGTFVRLYSRYAGVPTIVYFGADFFAASSNQGGGWLAAQDRQKEVVSSSPLYPLSTLLDPSTVGLSARIWGCTEDDLGAPTLSFKAVESGPRPAESAFKAAAERQQIEVLLHIFQKPGFAFYPDYRAMLASIKTGAPGARIVPFVPPETSLMFMSMMSQGRLDDYIHWLSMLVDAFQTVFVFDGVNHFTLDDAHFYDAHHVNTADWRPLVDIMEGRAAATPDGFGIALTRQNFDAYASLLRTEVCEESLKSAGDTLADVVPGCNGATEPDPIPTQAGAPIFTMNMRAPTNWQKQWDNAHVAIQDGVVTLHPDPSGPRYHIATDAIPVLAGHFYIIKSDATTSSKKMRLAARDGATGRLYAQTTLGQNLTFRAISNSVKVVVYSGSETSISAEIRAISLSPLLR